MNTTAPTGTHPYADMFPMASEDEINELAESISTVGLTHPITLTPDGLVLDGRNRLEACNRAGVEPRFVERDGDDDDLKEFVIGINTTGRRESMTVQIAAASVALILGHERRINGQWKRGSVPVSTESRTNTWQDAIRQAGLVLDVLGPAHLIEVRDGNVSLNATYEQARTEKERLERAERERIEFAKRQEREEEAAREFFATNNEAGVWLADRPGQHKTLYAAFKQYEAENTELRMAREAEQRAARAEQQRLHEEDKRVALRLQSFTESFSTAIDFRSHDRRDQVLDCMDKTVRAEFLTLEDHIKEWRQP